jgi:hypothetical protein
MMGPSLAEPECGVNRDTANIAFLPRLPVLTASSFSDHIVSADGLINHTRTGALPVRPLVVWQKQGFASGPAGNEIWRDVGGRR